MKILIIGSKGYIATAFAEFAKKAKKVEKVETASHIKLISVRDDSWRDASFVGYDVVLHTAGIAHLKETQENQYDYYIINRDLAVDVAKKAKADGVKHFIFLSSLSVYGLVTGEITSKTVVAPKTNYGRSKLAAEALIDSLADDKFKVAILRPPMVYGLSCPGNYSKLCRLVKTVPFFPDYPNARSLVSIENLCSFMMEVIEKRRSGIFHPCDPVAISTSKLAVEIAKEQGRNLVLTRIFNPFISLFMPVGVVSKMFGDLVIKVP